MFRLSVVQRYSEYTKQLLECQPLSQPRRPNIYTNTQINHIAIVSPEIMLKTPVM